MNTIARTPAPDRLTPQGASALAAPVLAAPALTDGALPDLATTDLAMPDLATADLATTEFRQVHRAAAELRRGAAILLQTAHGWTAVLAAETVCQRALDELIAQAGDPPCLIVTGPRAAGLLGRDVGEEAARGADLVALELTARPFQAGAIHRLADPTLSKPDQAHPDQAPLEALIRSAAVPAGAQAAIGLAKIARLLPAVLMASAGTLMGDDLLHVREEAVHRYPASLSTGLRRVAEADVPLESAPDARVIAFRPLDGGLEHLAIIIGDPRSQDAPLVRVHSACLTGDLLGSLRCDCGPQLRAALARMSQAGAGVLLYLAQEGRGIGLVNKLRAYMIQDRGQDTVDANLALGWEVDERSFLPAAIMLEQLGIRRVRLLTNNPAKLAALAAHGIEVVAREPHVTPPNGVNDGYLRAKAERLGHLLG